MTDPGGEPATNGDQPGDRPSAGRLSRPPSDRYAPRSSTNPETSAGSSPGSAGRGTRSAGSGPSAGALSPALAAGFVTAVLIVVVGGVLAEHRGLLAIAGLGGAAIGLLVARASASPDGVAAPALARQRATRIAAGLALATILLAAFGTWAFGRLEGGVMDPLSYLWQTMGLLLPAEAAIAMIAAAWGAGAGPIRWRA